MDIIDLKKVVKDLPEREVRSYLFHILLRIDMLDDMLKDKEYSLNDFSDDLKEIYNHILCPEEHKEIITFDKGNYKKVHVTFGYQFLRQALKELNILEEDFVITFYDNFAVAPIRNLETENGKKERFDWVKNNFNDEETEIYVDNFQKALTRLSSIPENVPIYIWVSENAHEQTGFLFIMHLLRERKNNIYQVDTGKLYKELFKKKSKKFVHFFQVK